MENKRNRTYQKSENNKKYAYSNEVIKEYEQLFQDYSFVKSPSGLK